MYQKDYKRDKRSPTPKNEAISKSMSGNKSKNTLPEKILRHELWKMGFKGFRKNYPFLPGKPDIVYTKLKIAIFVNGCFWHRCPHCNYSLPRHNTQYWQTKFSKNVERDKKRTIELENLGWTVIVVWECEIKADINSVVENISVAILNSKYFSKKNN